MTDTKNITNTRIIRINKYISMLQIQNGAWIKVFSGTHQECKTQRETLEDAIWKKEDWAEPVESFCAWLDRALAEAGFGLYGGKGEFCDFVGITRPTLYRYYAGVALPSLQTLRKICKGLEEKGFKTFGEYMAEALERM